MIGVVDGDTADVLHGHETIRLRFNGIDTPERGQPFGNNAKQFVSDQVFGKTIQVEAFDKDHHGRTIADLHFEQKRITLELVKAGIAWHYTQYSDEEALATAQVEAQRANRGLWSDPRHAVPGNW
ncbi:thermonuclease family protein [Novipirellula maiorica]|uniref:thermonuclease family protein n=1 Tax=Novipirellula maiorica TaxID=1265734 RepID=UPI00034C587D